MSVSNALYLYRKMCGKQDEMSASSVKKCVKWSDGREMFGGFLSPKGFP